MPATCSVCGRPADPQVDGDPPLTGSAERAGAQDDGAGAVRWVCAQCTRDNVRAIEAKLDQQWW